MDARRISTLAIPNVDTFTSSHPHIHRYIPSLLLPRDKLTRSTATCATFYVTTKRSTLPSCNACQMNSVILMRTSLGSSLRDTAPAAYYAIMVQDRAKWISLTLEDRLTHSQLGKPHNGYYALQVVTQWKGYRINIQVIFFNLQDNQSASAGRCCVPHSPPLSPYL